LPKKSGSKQQPKSGKGKTVLRVAEGSGDGARLCPRRPRNRKRLIAVGALSAVAGKSACAWGAKLRLAPHKTQDKI